MKPRDAQIPLLLWVCSAIVVHVCFRTGADEVKKHVEKLEEDRAGILKIIRGARVGIAGPSDKAASETELEFEPFVQLPPDDGPVTDDGKKQDEEVQAPEKPKVEEAPKPEKVELAKVEPPKIDPPKPEEPKAEEKPKEEDKPEEKVAEKDDKPIEVVPIPPEHKISVKLSNANNVDNPDAPRLAANASKVDEETMARDRSLDQDMPHPTSGTNTNGPAELIGHSSEPAKSGQTEENDGDPKRAPGESAKYSTDSSHEAPQPPQDAKAAANAGGPQGGGAPQPLAPQAASPGNVGGSGTPTPDSVASPSGGWSMDPARAGGSGTGNGAGDPSKKTDFVPNVRNVGLPIPGATPGPLQALGGQAQFEKAIGAEKLRKEREAIGKKIRAEQPGRLDTNKFERWRPAIENYDPSVKLGDETALNAAASPFADYLHDIHNRLHPIFGDEFLGGGAAMGAGLEDMTLVTHVEVVLSRDEGKILRMGITKQSGNTIFDAVALEAFDRASPYGKAPDAIVSPDGNVYLHWEFHRDPFDACSTRNAHGILLKNAPKLKPTEAPAKPKKPVRRTHDDTADDRRSPGPLLPLRKK
ncbi:MAG: hypothetical protein U0414_15655 [Polyangiaceae bacterium]